MVRRTALTLALAAVAAVAWAKKKAKPQEESSKQPPALHLRAIDLPHRLILVEVDGFTKAPPANYFTMTDERDRHYIAQTIHCDPPFPSGTRACELEIPLGYERHPLKTLELHRGGLHGKVIAVAPDEVRAAWQAALEAHAPPTEGPTANGAPAGEPKAAGESKAAGAPAPGDGGVLDSGISRTDAGK